MTRQKKTRKKERNDSIWFTGAVLLLVYVILFRVMLRTSDSAIESILRDPVEQIVEGVQEP